MRPPRDPDPCRRYPRGQSRRHSDQQLDNLRGPSGAHEVERQKLQGAVVGRLTDVKDASAPGRCVSHMAISAGGLSVAGCPVEGTLTAERPRTPLVKAIGITKRFGGALALDDVSVTMRRGSVHALVGENGAGKSTLGRILSGIIKPDHGELRLSGSPVRFATPRCATSGRCGRQPGADARTATVRDRERIPRSREAPSRHGRPPRPSESGLLTSSTSWASLCVQTRASANLASRDRQKVEVLRALAPRRKHNRHG